MDISFNINNTIKVRLTPRGHEIHRNQHDAIFSRLIAKKYPYRAPDEDENGWSKWQAWDFMSIFGPHIGLGANNPIETEIKFETDLESDGQSPTGELQP